MLCRRTGVEMDEKVQELKDTKHEVPAMVAEAREVLRNLFTGENGTVWFVCFPATDDPTPRPPSKKTYVAAQVNSFKESARVLMLDAVGYIGEGIDKIFCATEALYNTSYWSRFVNTLSQELTITGGLMGDARSEAEVTTDLLVPLLTRIAHASSMALSPAQFEHKEFVYVSALHSQTPTEERKHVRGRKPSVDFTMFGQIDEDDAMYLIPIEAKKKICQDDMCQLAQYMTTMVNGHYISSNTTMGMLVDSNTVVFAFSCLCLDKDTPLPVVLLTPAVKWRSGPILSRDVCVAMSLIHNLRLKRLLAGEQWERCLGSDTWKVIRRVALQAKQMKFTLPKSVPGTQLDLLRVMEGMRTEIETLREDVKRLKEQQTDEATCDSARLSKRARRK